MAAKRPDFNQINKLITLYGDCKEDKVFALGDMLKEEGYEIEKSWKNK